MPVASARAFRQELLDHRGRTRFAGDDENRARFFPDDDRYLVARDLHVDHFDVVHASGAALAGSVG